MKKVKEIIETCELLQALVTVLSPKKFHYGNENVTCKIVIDGNAYVIPEDRFAKLYQFFEDELSLEKEKYLKEIQKELG